MKKCLSLMISAVLLSGFSQNVSAEYALKDVLFPENYTRFEGAIWGSGVAFVAFLTAKMFLKDVPSVTWGSIPAGFILGYLGSHWGLMNRYTSSSWSQFAQKILDGEKNISDPVLLKKMRSLNKESAIVTMDALIETYGRDEASKALEKLREEIDVARRVLFETIKGSLLNSAWWTSVMGETEQQEFERSKKEVTAVSRSIDCVQRLLFFKGQFDDMHELLQVNPIVARLRGMSVDNEEEVVSRLYELYGRSETSKELSVFISLIVNFRKNLFDVQKKLPFLSVAQEVFDHLIHETDILLKNAASAAKIIDYAEAFNEVRHIMDGRVSEPTMLGIMRGKSPFLDDVVSSADKYGFLCALERLGRLNKDMEEVRTKLSLCQGSLCEATRAEVCRIQKNIQDVAQQIREDKRFEKQNNEFFREIEINTQHERAHNKGILLGNKQKELQEQIEKEKVEQEKYKRECKKFEKDKANLEYKLEHQKNKRYDAEVRYGQQKIEMASTLEREVRAVRSVKDLYLQISEEQRKTLEAKKALEEQKGKAAQYFRRCQEKEDMLTKVVGNNTSKLRDIIDVTNDHTKELEKIKNQLKENKKVIGSLSRAMNQANNPSHNPEYNERQPAYNPEYTEEHSEDQSTSAPEF